jgi:Family of unknown function (DUF5670)
MQLISIHTEKGPVMLNLIWAVAVILVVLWAVGLGTAYTMGGFIHILLVLAIVAVLVRLILGRRVV